MASEIINALFSAQDELSPTLSKIEQTTSSVGEQMEEFSEDLRGVASNSSGLDANLHEIDSTIDSVSRSTQGVKQGMESFDNTLSKVKTGTMSADEGLEKMQRSLQSMSASSVGTKRALESAHTEMKNVAGSANMSGMALRYLSTKLNDTTTSAIATNSTINELQDKTTKAALSSTALAAAQGRLNRRLATTIPTSAGASQQLGHLAAVAAEASFEMSSLSLNVGPFNLALKNILLQLPAVLVGLGSMVAVVSALAAAFATAAAGGAAFMTGGLIAFLEDLNTNFENNYEALTALGSALQDLISIALEPLVNAQNMSFFVEQINDAAAILNRFAQFFAIMREDIMRFFSRISIDLDALFTSLRRVFLAMEPILVRFINFILGRLPGALEFFAERTEVLLNSLAMLGDGFRKLFNELLVFAGVVINAVAPVVATVVASLAEFFAAVNSLNDSIIAFTAKVLALSLVGMKLVSMSKSLVSGFLTLNGIMRTQAAQSGALARIWMTLTGVAKSLFVTELTLSNAYSVLNASMRRHMNTLAGNIALRLQNIPLIGKELSAIWTLAMGLLTESVIRQAAVDSMKAYISAKVASITASLKEIPVIGGVTAALFAKTVALMSATAAYIQMAIAAAPLWAIMIGIGVAIASLVVLFDALYDAMGGVTGVVGSLKSALTFVADLLIGIFVPILNVVRSIFLLLATPMLSIVEGMYMLAEAMGLVSSDTSDSESMLSKIADTILLVVDALGATVNAASLIIKAFASIINTGILQLFEGLVFGIQKIGDLFGWLSDKIFKSSDNFNSFGDIATTVLDGLIEYLEQTVNAIDEVVKKLNTLPGVQIDGPEFDASEMRDSIRGEQEEEPKADEIETESNVNLSFREAVEQNIDVDADPEDEEGMKRTVKDALNEANALQRRRE